jgi:hypothetical protein
LNSGVIFFRKSPATAAFFGEWHRQWMRWQEWDEQLAVARAIHKSNVNCRKLEIAWNHPHCVQETIIWHYYKLGNARPNAA